MNRWNSTFKSLAKPLKRLQVKSKPKKPRKPKEKTLRNKLDILFSLYVRQKDSIDGYIQCYCGARIPWKDSDASHYIVRRHLATRYSERNVHPSCRRCNRFQGGNLSAYALYLESTYGPGILQELEREKQKTVRYFPYQELIEKYRRLLEEI